MKKIIITLLALLPLTCFASFEDFSSFELHRLQNSFEVLRALEPYPSFRISRYLMLKNFKLESHALHVRAYSLQLAAAKRHDESYFLLIYLSKFIKLVKKLEGKIALR